MDIDTSFVPELQKAMQENPVTYLETWRDILKREFVALDTREEMRLDGNIHTPRRYFCTMPFNDYSDIDVALPREFLQNSWDAGSTRIDLAPTENGFCFCDDGCGMTQDIILHKLLALGGTYKQGDCTGGFGKAKELLYFCWPDYIVHSQNNLLLGMQNRFSLFTLPESLRRQGTASRIQLWNQDSEEFREIFQDRYVASSMTNPLWLKHAAEDFVGHCFGHCPVFISGKEAKQLVRENCLIENETAEMHLLSGNCAPGIFVSINGILMFHNWTVSQSCSLNFKGQSLDAVTSNRDACKPPYDKFLDEAKEFLRNNENIVQKIEEKNIRYEYRDSASYIQPLHNDSAPVTYATLVADVAEKVTDTSEPKVATFGNLTYNTVQADAEESYGFWSIDIPEAQKKEVKNFLQSKKLVKRFSEMARETLRIVSSAALKSDSSLLPNGLVLGLTFGPQEAGYYLEVSGDPACIALNPTFYLDDLNAKNYAAATLKLLHVCTHEMAHTVVSSHNEKFASVMWNLTKNIADIVPDACERIQQAGKNALRRHQEEQPLQPS